MTDCNEMATVVIWYHVLDLWDNYIKRSGNNFIPSICHDSRTDSSSSIYKITVDSRGTEGMQSSETYGRLEILCKARTSYMWRCNVRRDWMLKPGWKLNQDIRKTVSFFPTICMTVFMLFLKWPIQLWIRPTYNNKEKSPIFIFIFHLGIPKGEILNVKDLKGKPQGEIGRTANTK